MILRVEFQFNAAHRLPYYEGPCFRTHGHNYRLLVMVKGPVDPKIGLSIDFLGVKALVRKHVLNRIDHNELKPHLPGLVEMHLYETDDSSVVYRGEASSATSRDEPDEKVERA